MGIQREKVIALLALAVLLLSGCGGVVLKTRLYCRNTGAVARYSLRLPPGSPYDVESLAAVRACLSGECASASLSLRRLVVRFILDVTENANSGRGRIRSVKGPDGPHFWIPTPFFTHSANGDSYSVAGLAYPLFSMKPVSSGEPHRWRRISYSAFRAAAERWLESAAPPGEARKTR